MSTSQLIPFGAFSTLDDEVGLGNPPSSDAMSSPRSNYVAQYTTLCILVVYPSKKFVSFGKVLFLILHNISPPSLREHLSRGINLVTDNPIIRQVGLIYMVAVALIESHLEE